MFLKNRYIIIIYCCITLGTSQCVSEADINIPVEGVVLTIVSHPEPGSPIRATIGTSSPIDSSTTLPVDFSPTITILEDDVSFDVMRLFVSDLNDKPFWSGAEQASVSTEYSITINAPGYPVVTAHTTIPKPSEPIIKANMNSIPPVISGELAIKQIPLTISVKDIAQTDSLFIIYTQFSKYNTAGGDIRQTGVNYLSVGPSNAHLITLPDNSLLIEKKYWQTAADGLLKFTVVVEYMAKDEVPATLDVEWRTVSKEYYRYYLSLSRQGNTNLPFSDPDVLYNNVEGGYGTFSGFSRVLKVVPL
jgi:Domain of unknown function (DUF4249)